MKKSKIIISLLSSTLLIGAVPSIINASNKAISTSVSATIGEVLDVTTLPVSNTPVAGWGTFNVNKTCTGDPIVVNGVTYEKGFGTHVYNDIEVYDGDISFDISSLSSQYEFFEAKVAQPETGNNCIRFIVLVDGVEKDSIIWRKGFGDGNPYVVRCSIKGGSTLTLRTLSCGYGNANGTSVWIEPKLFNFDNDDVFEASVLLKRLESNTGWGAYLGNDVSYAHALFDQRVDGTQFSAYVPYGDVCQFKSGIGTQLTGSTYEAYSADKTNTSLYSSLKFDIKDRGFTLFNTVVSMAKGGGCYVDAWIDGVEAYHHETMISSADNGEAISIAIPDDAEEFELKIVPNNGFGDGLVDIMGAQFLIQDNYLITYPSVDVYVPEFRWPVPHGYANNGRAPLIRDSELDKEVLAEKSLMIHAHGEYTFDVSGITFDTLKGKVACANEETGHGTNALVATFTYADGTSFSKSSDEFNYANSNIDFAFHFYPTGLKTIKLELSGDFPCSKSFINAPMFTSDYAKLDTLIKDLLLMETYTEEKGWCADSEHHYYADAKAWFNETLSDGERAEFLTDTVNVKYANACARLMAWAAANGDDLNVDNKLQTNDRLNVLNSSINNQSALLVTLIGLFVVLGIAAVIVLKRKHN